MELNASKLEGFQGEIQTHTLVREELDLAALREQETAIQQLEEDIKNVNEIFKDLAYMVHDQGEMVDDIEEHFENVHLSIELGTEEIKKAKAYQARQKKRKIVLFTSCGIALGLIVYFYSRK
ncbi:unnamed protein product [Darwinula stevensoni]|uniref:t-SNARE coiled-coil homology domain-containing protein n=1 Tax=Darwinula stevensoni TaxID=69355 RepID=A0A7R9AFG5_9CRUS|nr:unnamed protein product [Darwinula stevensoni]CAG0902381.1 unnamed protein product [Darwinula stevensoni]